MELTETKIQELADAAANSTALEHEKDRAEETKKWLAETKEEAEKIIYANTFEYEAMCESEIIQDVVSEILEG